MGAADCLSPASIARLAVRAVSELPRFCNITGFHVMQPNVDPSAVAQFDRLAARWWDPDGESRALHDLNPARLGYVMERVELRGLDVLDVGCGGGLLSEALAAQGAKVTGIDLAPAVLETARLHLYESGLQVDYREIAAEALAAECEGGFDVITCMEMLEHVRGGLLSEALAAQGAKVTGIDLAPAVLETARLHLYESGLQVDYREIAAEALAAECEGRFDVITCMEMLEHVPDPAAVIAACARLLRPGGWLFLSTLNRTPQAFALAIAGAEYVMRLLPRGTHRYAQFIRPSELSAALRTAGLALDDVSGLQYNPFTRSARVGGPTAINYLAAARKPSSTTSADCNTTRSRAARVSAAPPPSTTWRRPANPHESACGSVRSGWHAGR